MENNLLKLAASQGIWTTLSIFLIFYILKAQEKRDISQKEREKNYQHIITDLTDKFNIIEQVKSNVEYIKDYISEKK